MSESFPVETSEARAFRHIAEFVSRLRGARTPAYPRPDLKVVKWPSCAPRFAEAMRAVVDLVRLDDPACCHPDVATLLRYHRMYGRKKLFKESLSAHARLAGTEAMLQQAYFTLGLDLTFLIGELLLRTLGADQYDAWFPHHNFTVAPHGDRAFHLLCESLEVHTGSQGQAFYASSKAPTLLVKGHRKRLGFAPHALDRLGERANIIRSYASLGDAFGLVETSHHYATAMLHGTQEAVALFEVCAPGFFSEQYARNILGTLDPKAQYVYRVGYAPLADEGAFVVAKTVLPPGYAGTPEVHALRRTSFDPGVQERLLARSAEQSYAMLCASRDFTLLRWFHQHGIPQIYRLDQDRLVPA